MWWLIVSVCAFWIGYRIDRSIKKDKQTMKDMDKREKIDTMVAALDLEPVKQKEEPALTSHISKVLGLVKEHKLSDTFWQEADSSLSALSRALDMTPQEVFIFSLFVELSDERQIHLNDIARLLRCNQVDIMCFSAEMESLRKRKLIRRRRTGNGESDTWRVPQMVLQALLRNECYESKPTVNLTLPEFLDTVKTNLAYVRQHEVSLAEFVDELDELLDANLHLPFCVQFKATAYRLNAAEKLLLAHACVLYADFVDKIDADDYDYWLENDKNFHRTLHLLATGDNPLLNEGIFENIPDESFGSTTLFRLTEKVKEDLQLNEVAKHKSDMARRNLIAGDSIVEKQLYFNPSEQEHFDRLSNLLMPDTFQSVCNSLKSNGMRQGFACLFYGSPGTGKTESVYQLARKTGRDIMHVDIAQSKSKWFGESEKRIKSIFNRYRSIVRDCKVAPILLFNEADAILGCRNTVGTQGAIDKTENAMQNILLQEIEQLEGILIATTNLTQNLDKAFERRFLYKIEFGRPLADARRHIWQSMFPGLTEQESQTLAQEFDLSGGEIENVVRKSTVDRVLNITSDADAERTPLNTLRRYCREESSFSKNGTRRRVGY